MNSPHNIDKSLVDKALEKIANNYSDKNERMVAETFLDAKIIFGLEARLQRVESDFIVKGESYRINEYLGKVNNILKEVEYHIPVTSEDSEGSIGRFSGRKFEGVYKLLDNDVDITGRKEVVYRHLEEVRHGLNDLAKYIGRSAEDYATSVGMSLGQLEKIRRHVIDIDKII